MIDKIKKYSSYNLKNSKIGILGGGQLGKMIAESAKKSGYHTTLYCPPGDNPAEKIVDEYISGTWKNIKKLNELSSKVTVVTSEFENVPSNVLDFLSKKTNVQPSSFCFDIAQFRDKEKMLAKKAGFLVPKWFKISSYKELEKYSKILNFDCILKTNSQGYDGKGQRTITCKSELESIWKEINFEDCILEEKIQFNREISILYARSLDESECFFPISENHHENGILKKTIAPTGLSCKLEKDLKLKIRNFANLLNLKGILTIEFFQKNNSIIFNEIAPRPHNSFHWTIEGCKYSQFDILLKCLLGLKVKDQKANNCWKMVNLLGKEIVDLDKLNFHPNQKIHLYGKKEIKEGRKMGHVTYPFEK